MTVQGLICWIVRKRSYFIVWTIRKFVKITKECLTWDRFPYIIFLSPCWRARGSHAFQFLFSLCEEVKI